MILFCLGENQTLATSVCRAGQFDAGNLNSRKFPDGETYIRILDQVRNKHTAILCSLRDPDARIPSLLFLADALREQGAASVGLAAPYLCYMRQDRRFQPGEAITSRTFAKMISAGFDWLITIDPHLHRISSLSEIYSIPAVSLHAASLIADWVEKTVPEPLIIGPDAESRQWAAEIARAHPCIVLEKQRLGDREVEIQGLENLPVGRTPVLVDDMISSARTMIVATELIRAQGFSPVCIAVHPLFHGSAFEDLKASGAATIASCNTITHPSNQIDVSGMLASAIQSMLNEMQKS
ncbi:MAG TPA: ribose-phosphate pyrophosphokinase [Leptospiraceae bacterium]|nr:ribose-phosphate pyrophosphokinase [Leptospirales bacterium]HMW61016.1 ribose-phosphate pyrophosphokinase [Leptospiraceae bacterium]HMX55155.1 ribose-phosphate pyrophosphokinase [Leptospiraceae bacterium]HMY44098.1 ribose-phosphate pyrophosphokinase [Leptospiraceae bacterium]HMZ38116.1 ribose-phosphate pyrophosphokinase [Leptospiraceae bacterium]